MPGSSIPKSRLLQIEHIDKVIHFTMFFVFSLLLIIGFFRQNVLLNLKNDYIIYAVLISIFYGAITEITQSIWFSSRIGNFWDFIANSAGAITGILFFNKLIKRILPDKVEMNNDDKHL